MSPKANVVTEVVLRQDAPRRCPRIPIRNMKTTGQLAPNASKGIKSVYFCFGMTSNNSNLSGQWSLLRQCDCLASYVVLKRVQIAEVVIIAITTPGLLRARHHQNNNKLLYGCRLYIGNIQKLAASGV